MSEQLFIFPSNTRTNKHQIKLAAADSEETSRNLSAGST